MRRRQERREGERREGEAREERQIEGRPSFLIRIKLFFIPPQSPQKLLKVSINQNDPQGVERAIARGANIRDSSKLKGLFFPYSRPLLRATSKRKQEAAIKIMDKMMDQNLLEEPLIRVVAKTAFLNHDTNLLARCIKAMTTKELNFGIPNVENRHNGQNTSLNHAINMITNPDQYIHNHDYADEIRSNLTKLGVSYIFLTHKHQSFEQDTPATNLLMMSSLNALMDIGYDISPIIQNLNLNVVAANNPELIRALANLIPQEGKVRGDDKKIPEQEHENYQLEGQVRVDDKEISGQRRKDSKSDAKNLEHQLESPDQRKFDRKYNLKSPSDSQPGAVYNSPSEKEPGAAPEASPSDKKPGKDKYQSDNSSTKYDIDSDESEYESNNESESESDDDKDLPLKIYSNKVFVHKPGQIRQLGSNPEQKNNEKQ